MFSSEISIWLLVYVLPLLVGSIFTVFVPLERGTKKWLRVNTVALNVACLISFALSQYVTYSSGSAFPWELSLLSGAFLVISIILAAVFIGKLGLVYFVSAFIQEATMLSLAYLLFPTLSVWLVILLIVPIFVVLHFLYSEKWILRLILLVLWGSVSILLFSVTLNFYLLASLHTILGAFFISKSIISSKSTWSFQDK